MFCHSFTLKTANGQLKSNLDKKACRKSINTQQLDVAVMSVLGSLNHITLLLVHFPKTHDDFVASNGMCSMTFLFASR